MLFYHEIILFFSHKRIYKFISLFILIFYNCITIYNTTRLNMCHENEEDFSARYTDRGSVKGQISL